MSHDQEAPLTLVTCPKCGRDYDDPDFDEFSGEEPDQCCECDTKEYHRRTAMNAQDQPGLKGTT